MEEQRENETLGRLRRKIIQGVLGCLFAVGVMLLMPGTEMKAQAAYFTENGITYEINPDGETCSVTLCNPAEVGTEVHVPAKIKDTNGNTYRVIKIIDGVFNSKSLEKITLEEGLEIIGEQAFYENNIEEIEIPASVNTIGQCVVANCDQLQKIRFRGMIPPSNMDYAFSGISGTTIEIPEGANANDWETALRRAGLFQYTIRTYPTSSGSSSASSSSSAEQGSEIAEGEQVSSIPEHVCQYEWETVREAGAGQDGLERYLCKLCGDIQATLTIPAAQYQVQELYTKVTGAATGETVTYDMGQIHTVCDKLFTKLQQRSDITLILTYQYKGTDYQTTFPAGADYTELLEDEEQFYGMLGLNGHCGIVTE